MDPKLQAAIEKQRAAHAEMTRAVDEVDALITTDDATDEQREAAQAAFDTAEADYRRATAEVERIEHLNEARALVPRDLPTPAATTSIRVTKEERTYRPQGGPGFFRDLIASREGDSQARDRLLRNNLEYDDQIQHRAGVNQTATSGGEFVPPVWYVDQYAPLLRVGRPFLNSVGTKPLPPDTNSLNFPKITTGASVAVQSDAGAVSNTDLVTTSVTAQVQTEAGRTIASYQFVELGPVSDQVIMQDLMFAYQTQLDKDAINGSVTNAKGLLNVTSPNTVTYTDATPTGAEFYTPVMQGASQIAKNAFVSTDLIVTHPSVWYNILAGLDANSRPLYLAVGPGFNTGGAGTVTDAYPDGPGTGNGIVGNIAGVPLCVDANIPTNLGAGTNEARMVLLNRQGFDFWESAPRFKVADQTSIANLQYQFVMYGYYAVTSRQSKMISIISGTGLIPLTGF